jgi:hypothetical protein
MYAVSKIKYKHILKVISNTYVNINNSYVLKKFGTYVEVNKSNITLMLARRPPFTFFYGAVLQGSVHCLVRGRGEFYVV